MENWPAARTATPTRQSALLRRALATLDLVEHEYTANAAEVGAYFLNRLRALEERHPEAGDVRGRGLFIGMELVKDRASKVPAKEFCDATITRAFHNGMLLLSCGASTIRFAPPLMVSRGEVDEAVTILDASLAEAREALGRSRRKGGGVTMRRCCCCAWA